MPGDRQEDTVVTAIEKVFARQAVASAPVCLLWVMATWVLMGPVAISALMGPMVVWAQMDPTVTWTRAGGLTMDSPGRVLSGRDAYGVVGSGTYRALEEPALPSVVFGLRSLSAPHGSASPSGWHESPTWGEVKRVVPPIRLHLDRPARVVRSLEEVNQVTPPVHSLPRLWAGEIAAMPADPSRHNVLLAGGLSLVVPGLGQAYNRNWIRSALAIAIEGGLVTAYFVWRRRGFDGERAYKEYAHRFWDPARYAAWLNDYVIFLEQADGAMLGAVPIEAPSGVDFSAPGSWTDAQRRLVRDFFEDVHVVEDLVYHPSTGASFSHNLPYFAEQQYYELIGKYFQFAPGWRDYPDWKKGDAFTDAINPDQTGSDGSKPNVRGYFLDYARDHAAANTLLRRASRASAFLILHHFVATLDALISAKLHNHRIQSDLSVGVGPIGDPQVSAALAWRM